jgi:hypothetical protein
MVISAGLTSYCFGLPLTVRFSFYPVLGEYRWGWIGEFIDAWSIVTTLAKQKMETLQILRGWVGGQFFIWRGEFKYPPLATAYGLRLPIMFY